MRASQLIEILAQHIAREGDREVCFQTASEKDGNTHVRRYGPVHEVDTVYYNQYVLFTIT